MHLIVSSCIAQQPNALAVTTQRALFCCKRSFAAPYATGLRRLMVQTAAAISFEVFANLDHHSKQVCEQPGQVVRHHACLDHSMCVGSHRCAIGPGSSTWVCLLSWRWAAFMHFLMWSSSCCAGSKFEVTAASCCNFTSRSSRLTWWRCIRDNEQNNKIQKKKLPAFAGLRAFAYNHSN